MSRRSKGCNDRWNIESGYRLKCRVDVDEVGGAQAVYTEGLPPALGTFMLAWIFIYTAGHSDVS